MKKAVYTFIFGDYDKLKAPKIVTPGWDYICFSDNPDLAAAPPWEIRPPALPEHHDKKKWAIAHMILAHQVLPDHDLTISIGGQIQVNCNLDEFVARRFREGTDLMLIRHPERACVYDEAEACKALGKDDPKRIDTQMKDYRAGDLPPSLGLYATGIVGRRHGLDSQVRIMCEDWWKHVGLYSRRDQLALPFALYCNGPAAERISELGWHQTFGNTMGADQSFIIHPHAPTPVP